MNKRLSVRLSATFVLLIAAACGDSGATFDATAHSQEILEWRAWRIERLKEPSGYLNQIALYWLEPGSYRFGSADDNDIVFRGNAAPAIGVFTVREDGVSMAVNDGIEVLVDDERVSDLEIPADTTDRGIMARHGSMAWTVIERVGKYAIRLRDFEHPFVDTFGPLPYFDIDPNLRVQATLRRFPKPKIANVGTVIEGLGYHPEMPGLVEFEIDGETYKLEAYTSGDSLFYVFGDQTNRDATYGAGRFLYSATPGEDGVTVLDFNKSYSPPCAFNDFSTCPVASPRNRLPIRVEAGEKFNDSLHFSADD